MKSFLSALQFLTRLRVTHFLKINEEAAFGRSMLFFPLIGLMIGVLLALVAFCSNFIFQPLTTAILVLAAEFLITGGLHLDGLMDSADGLLSGREREKVLIIMKDSCVGGMAVLAVFFLLSLKLAFLTELFAENLFVILIAMPVIGRWAIIYTMISYPYARKEGLGGIFHQQARNTHLIITSLYSAGLLLFILPVKLYPAPLLTVLCVFLCAHRINKVLGGHTGDTYGAANELAELFFLFWCAVLTKI